MAFSPLSGYVASVKISTTSYAFNKFSISEDADLGKVTNFTGAGAHQYVAGTYRAVIKLEGPYDEGNMSAFAPNAAVDLDFVFVTGTSVTIECLVKNFTITVDVENAQQVEMECWSNGSFTLGPL